MKKPENKFSFKKILNFPAQINIVGLVLIVILYGLILYIIANVSTPKITYGINLDNEGYQYGIEIPPMDFNTYLSIAGEPFNKSSNKEEFNLGIKYDVYGEIKSESEKKPSSLKFYYSLLGKHGETKYLKELESQRKVRLGTSVKLDHDIVSRVYMKIRYKMDNNYKTMRLMEDMLSIPTLAEQREDYNSLNKIDDVVVVNFKVVKNIDQDVEESYDFRITLSYLSEVGTHHINMQTWLITDTDETIPFFGLYNYRTNQTYIYNKKISLEKITNSNFFNHIRPRYIVMKLNYQDDLHGLKSIKYKVAIADLLS